MTFNKKLYRDYCKDYICFDCRVRANAYESNIRERERLEREMEHRGLKFLVFLLIIIPVLSGFISKAFIWLLKFWITSKIIVEVISCFIFFVAVIGFWVWLICYGIKTSFK